MKTHLRPTVFRRAAKLLTLSDSNTYFACHALNSAGGNNHHDEVAETVFFRAITNPHNGHDPWYSYGYGDDPDEQCSSEERMITARILGLLLCELLVKEGWTA